jgi:hypothetical protein
VGVVDNMQEWQCVLLTHVCMGGATQVLLLPKHRAAQAAAAASTTAARQDAADPATAVEDQFESAQQVLEDCLERLDTALDAAQQQLQEYKDEGIARPGAMTISGPLASWRLTGSGVKGAACVLDNAAAGRGRVGLPQAAAGAGSRPQDRFATPVDNSNAPWWPTFKHLAGRVTGPPAAGEAAAHPYREELQQLRCVLRGSRGARGWYRACYFVDGRLHANTRGAADPSCRCSRSSWCCLPCVSAPTQVPGLATGGRHPAAAARPGGVTRHLGGHTRVTSSHGGVTGRVPGGGTGPGAPQLPLLPGVHLPPAGGVGRGTSSSRSSAWGWGSGVCWWGAGAACSF